MSEGEVYPWGLVKRLLEAWPELAQGQYPRDENALEGYRGRQFSESAPFEAAIIGHADLSAAVARLPPFLARAVVTRYWKRQRPGPQTPRWNLLVDSVWRELNRGSEMGASVGMKPGRTRQWSRTVKRCGGTASFACEGKPGVKHLALCQLAKGHEGECGTAFTCAAIRCKAVMGR